MASTNVSYVPLDWHDVVIEAFSDWPSSRHTISLN